MGPGHRGLIAEDLYGHRVTPGEHPMDLLIAAIDRNYLDFDVGDEKIQALAQRVYRGEPPQTPEQWQQEIMGSSQDDKLKQKLVSMLGDVAAKPETRAGTGRIRIETIRGSVIEADAIKEVMGLSGIPIYYVGFGPTNKGRLTSQWNRVKTQAPEFFEKVNRRLTGGSGRMRWKFENIITINKANVSSIQEL